MSTTKTATPASAILSCQSGHKRLPQRKYPCQIYLNFAISLTTWKQFQAGVRYLPHFLVDPGVQKQHAALQQYVGVQ
jgi:hypothetical protein